MKDLKHAIPTVSLMIIVGGVYEALIRYFILPNERFSVIEEILIGIIWGGFIAVMYFIQLTGVGFILRKNDKIFYVITTIIFIFLVWVGILFAITQGLETHIPDNYNWVYLSNLLLSILAIFKANHDGNEIRNM